VEEARAAGFPEINIDMMYGLPGQDLATMRKDLARVLELSPEHLTYYPLYYYEASVLGKTRRSDTEEKEAVLDLVYGFYRELCEAVDAAGYSRYGREYFSKGDRRHRYQGDYVAGNPLIGFGHSAYSYNGEAVFVRDSDFASYMASGATDTIVRGHWYGTEDSDRRKFVLGSRNRSIPKDRFENLAALAAPIELAKKFGFLTETETTFELTETGLEYQEVFTHLFV
jgi:coproporphyrinogen III oxidase-like Fe-S oxidoreductase